MRFSTLSAGILSGLLLCAALSSCGGSDTATLDDFNTRIVTLPNGQPIKAEWVADREMMARGMMFRDSLAPDHGMLFLHEKEGRYQYWMHNCKIPLDIIWMDNDRHVVEISADTPPCRTALASQCPTYGGHADSRYVLELAAGQAKKQGLKVGDQIAF